MSNQNYHKDKLRLPTVKLPAREATIMEDVDVLVVGGGPAGIGAALGAAWAGAPKVMLVERYGFLGGNATAALVMPLMSFYAEKDCGGAGAGNAGGYSAEETQERSCGFHSCLPSDHGPGRPVIGGAIQKLIDRLVAAGGAKGPSLQTGYVTLFDPEVLKMVAMEMLDEAGVQFLMHAFASGVVRTSGGRVDGVVFETKSGPVVVRASMIVDATGDGDVAAQAGARFQVGRTEDGMVQPMTLMFRMADFQLHRFSEYVSANPDQWQGVQGLKELVKQAVDGGEFQLPREDLLIFDTMRSGQVSINSTRVGGGGLGTDVLDLTHAELVGRRQMHQVAAFMRKYVPGFENAFISDSAMSIGVRETRRVTGDYCLTADDLLAGRKFDDVIARNCYPIDIHDPSGKGTTLKKLPSTSGYDIPLGSLLPAGLENVLVSGRCISGTHEAHSSYRVTPACMATGQAAGVAAALAAKAGVADVRQVPVRLIQKTLLSQGAILHEESDQ